MTGPRIGSLFTGTGALDMAVMDVLGGSLAWHCQYDPEDRHQYAARILAHHWPDVPNLGDVTAVDWASVEPVDVLTAGFPCQDVSLAGKRAGLGPGTRTGLWAEVVKAAVALRPRFLFLENVRGLMSGEWDELPSDRCLCGWPYRRGGLHRYSPPKWRRSVHAARGRGDDSEGESPAGGAQGALRRPRNPQPQGDGTMGGRLRLEDPRFSGRNLLAAGQPIPATEGRTGATRLEGRGDQAVAEAGGRPAQSVDRGGPGALRCPEGADPRAEQEGARAAAQPWHGDADCPACGRPVGDVPVRSVFRSGVATVLRDLAEIGFDAEWTCVRASDVGAPHQRERWFCLAWPADAHGPRWEGDWVRGAVAERDRAAAHADDEREHGRGRSCGEPQRHLACSRRAAAHAAGLGPGEPTDETLPDAESGEARAVPGGRGERTEPGFGGDATLADPAGERHGHSRPARERGLPPAALASAAADADCDAVRQQPVSELGSGSQTVAGLAGIEWGAYGPAVHRWAHILGRPAPSPVDDRGRLDPRFVEWMMGLPEGHVCDVPAPDGMTAAGLRNARLKALGNGVVRQQGAYAKRVLLHRMRSEVAA